MVGLNSRTTHLRRQAFCLALVLALPGGAQNVPSSPTNPQHGPFIQPNGQRAGDSQNGMGPGDPAEQESRLRALNLQRQKTLVSDTNKLLALANEYDAEVKGSASETLTPAQLRKLAAIEKLARSVKEKMSYTLRGPVYQDPPFAIH
jgi:hypothetical protein